MLTWCDNFQQYGTDTNYMLNGLYAEVSHAGTKCLLVADVDPTASGNVLKLVDNASGSAPFRGAYVRKVVGTVATGGVMQRIWLTELPTSTLQSPYIAFTDSGNTTQVIFVISPIGTIKAHLGNLTMNPATQTQIGESSVCIVANAWQHLEIKLNVHDSTGTIEVRVEGITVLTLTGKDTKNSANTSYSNIIWGYASTVGDTSAFMYVKDVACWDTTGTLNNDFLGICSVYSMRPDSDDAGTWDITGNANAYGAINETTPNDDTKYVSSPWPAATADVFTLTDLPAAATRVLGMMSMIRSRKSDGGDGSLQISMKSGASTGAGSDRPITTAYTYWTDIFETDPATSAAWSVAAANASKLKLNRTA